MCWNSLLRLSSPGDPNAVSQALEEVLKMAPKLDAKELRRLTSYSGTVQSTAD